jgi:hypothetical protein
MDGEYYKTKESVKEYIELAKDVNGSELIEKLKQVLPLKSDLLEIGSGPGTDWVILNESYTVTGSDNSPEFLKYELIESIRRQSEILNINGIVCHSFWRGKGFEIFKGLYVNYHNEEEISDFFEDYFNILSISVYQEFEEGDSILLIGRKK